MRFAFCCCFDAFFDVVLFAHFVCLFSVYFLFACLLFACFLYIWMLFDCLHLLFTVVCLFIYFVYAYYMCAL